MALIYEINGQRIETDRELSESEIDEIGGNLNTPTVNVSEPIMSPEEAQAVEMEIANSQGIPETPTQFMGREMMPQPDFVNPLNQETQRALLTNEGVLRGAMVDPVNAIKQFFGEEDRRQIAESDARYEARRREFDVEGFDVPRLLGSIASPFNIVGGAGGLKATNALSKFSNMFSTKVAQGAGTSIGAGAFLPVTSETEAVDQFVLDKIAQTGISGLLGAGLSKLAGALTPQLREGAAEQIARGVEVSPGQAYQGVPGWVFRQLESIRFGDALSTSQKRSFTQSTANEVLSSIGTELPKGLKDGQAMVGFTKRALSQHYDKALSQINLVNLDNAYINSVKLAMTRAKQELSPAKYKMVSKLVEQNLKTKVKAMGADLEIDGKQLKELDGFLKARKEAYRKGTDSDTLGMSNLFSDLHDATTAFTERVDPSGLIKQANAGWTKLYRFAEASKRASAQGGNITPQQLMGASTKQSTVLQSGAGEAPMQKFAKKGLDILGADDDPLKLTYRSLAVGSKGLAGGALAWANPAIAIPVMVAGGMSYAAAKALMKNPSRARVAFESALQKIPPRTATLILDKAKAEQQRE